MNKLLKEIDDLLARLEDYTHGKDGEDITEMRKRIQKDTLEKDEWINNRIYEVDNTIELYQRCIKLAEETISINTPKFMSMDEVDDNQKENAETRLDIYKTIIDNILIPTKNNYLKLKN